MAHPAEQRASRAIQEIAKQTLRHASLFLSGSRARGDARRRSDFDLAVLPREGFEDAEVHNRIITEERARLRRERGLPEIEPGSAEADIDEAWWENEVDAATEELFEADLTPLDEERRHPLVERCEGLSLRIADDIEHYGWATEHATTEHPLHEITNSLCSAAAKLAGPCTASIFGRKSSTPAAP